MKYGLDTDANAITGLYVRNVTDGDPWMPGQLAVTDGCDLNKGAGGDLILLYFSRGGPQVIRSVAIGNTSDERYYYSKPGTFSYNDGEGRTYSWDWYKNLNAGCGGDADNIWIGWSYDLVD